MEQGFSPQGREKIGEGTQEFGITKALKNLESNMDEYLQNESLKNLQNSESSRPPDPPVTASRYYSHERMSSDSRKAGIDFEKMRSEPGQDHMKLKFSPGLSGKFSEPKSSG